MCCLFGILNYSGMKNPAIDKLVNYLAQESTIRGMDSTGIAYNKNGKLKIYKKAKNAYEMDFKGLERCVVVTGHTRHATQGSAEKNYNNHPFFGNCENARFALSHNGVIWNDSIIRKNYGLPENRIETDSYIAVQLLEHFQELTVENVASMAEIVQGSYTFTIADNTDKLWIIKGDNPMSIIHFPQWELYVYASTKSILFTALCRTDFVDDIESGDFEMLNLRNGDIVQIDKHGNVSFDRFNFCGDDWWKYDWKTWNNPATDTNDSVQSYWEDDYESQYLDEIKSVARWAGIDDSVIDELYGNGFTLEELEDFIYSYK